MRLPVPAPPPDRNDVLHGIPRHLVEQRRLLGLLLAGGQAGFELVDGDGLGCSLALAQLLAG